MRTTRRGFFGMVAGAVAAAVLPKPVKKWTVYPPVQVDLPPAHVPMVGDLIFWRADGVWLLHDGKMEKLSKEWSVESAGLHYWQDDKYIGAYAGISRRQHGQQGQD